MTTTITKLSLCKAALAALVLASGLSGLAAKPAHAEVATVTNTNDSGSGSLRSAIQAANGNPGADTINFNIPGSEVKTIRPSSPLPQITDPLIIDGYSQPGSSPNTQAVGSNAVPKIELDGSLAGDNGEDGLTVRASNSLIKGLVINRFDGDGVFVFSGASGTKIEGNFVGTDPSGTQDLGNGDMGVRFLNANSLTVGGASPAARNLLSGNDGDGILIDQSGGTQSREVMGNLIGTQKNGSSPLGNARDGVSTFRASNVKVGGDPSASANTIAFNGGDGVRVDGFASQGNNVLRNSIFSNDGLGIDLGPDGSTANDPGDADEGDNGLQNKPALPSASTAGGSTTIQGTLNSKPSQTFVVRFFSDPSGNEGKVFRGKKSVTTNANGSATFSFSTAQAVPAGHRMTATATDSGGNTSEFSAPKSVVAQ
jgi:hypothetical protein